MKHIIPFLIFVIFLNSCSSEFKPATFDTITVEEPFEAEISAVYSKATGNSELSNSINSNVENAIIATLNTSESKINLTDVLKAFNEEYLSFRKDYAEIDEPAWELHIETELVYQSDAIITIAISTYEFKGGAHGNDKIKLLNLDAKSGKTIQINDFINDIDGFTALAKAQFIKSLEKNKDQLTIENFFFGEPFQLPENIGFSEEGLVLIYNVYEVASYDLGYTEFMIPFDDVESYLKMN
ncbi:DUF3298 and DUF4163 domain-containing protein [Winogradskyella thalassocola]|uniref:Deacetylase PdaC domain-containing protein n=1 Tax=Winogradskyella thalassocola TaxID=262004 RepID=A0A1G7W6S1_9FLAO|nr:DUF3298 and DUF4163 domain-containing protein [Winogradskyella thalassocola]SDG67643.1 Protein of unknown function [Winogradskyella thalassocola]